MCSAASDTSFCQARMTTLYTPRSEVSRALPKPTGNAGQVLQFEGDVLEDVTRPGAVMQALHEAAPLADAAAVLDQRGQQGWSGGRAGRG